MDIELTCHILLIKKLEKWLKLLTVMSEAVIEDDGIVGDRIIGSEKPSILRLQMNTSLVNSKYTDQVPATPL